MNIQESKVELREKVQLPLLVKGPSSYKLIVPRKVEEKIRYLCRKFPTLEWSGVLFISYTGRFKDGSLTITCQDIYPMDLGSGTFTEFKMDASVAGYIAENMDLFGCEMSLVHSHNQMATFFSGTDMNTLRAEGNDQNCFVSLIVNNAGKYSAAVTRKVQKKTEVVTKSLGTSYQFFGQGAIVTEEDPMSERTEIIDNEVIEYFPLDIEVESAENPLAYLDARFDEIEARKKEEGRKKKEVSAKVPSVYTPGSDYDKDAEFYDWIHSERKKSAEAKETGYSAEVEEPTLFDEATMKELEDASMWYPDPTIIHRLICQMIVCSLVISDTDIKQWIIRHMEKKYKEIFENPAQFDSWKEFIVEFMIYQYPQDEVPDALIMDEIDMYYSKIAEAMHSELSECPTNSYIEEYKEVLQRYIV